MKNKRIFIRADGGNEIGMGHIMRTSVLAKELREHAEVYYLSSKGYEEGIRYLEQQGYFVFERNEEQIVEVIRAQAPDILITDHYGSGKDYMSKVQRYCGKTVYIDDNADRNFIADMIINQNYRAEQLVYHVQQEDSKCLLLGSKYLMMRDEYRESEVIEVKKKVNDILLTVGGGDPHNITNSILSQISALPYNFHVVIGGNFPYEEQLRKCHSKPNISFYKQPEMSMLMRRMDMAISSCGSTLYELGTLGIPTLGIIVAYNQEGLAERLQEDGVIWLLGTKDDIENMQLAKKIKELDGAYDERKRININNPKLFNKNGVYEIVKEILANDR